ncbi:MAG: TIGR01777 family protein [Gammaproteobacteria bacterium]|nr:TIGR01777 family protein [Gammaproteobacteria bacterium]
MKILISGASGLIGSRLSQYLHAQGHHVLPLYRGRNTTAKNYWLPEKNIIRLDENVKFDAVIHLAGENIADGRWSTKRKAAILESRVNGTRLIAKAVASLQHKPSVFISASAIGFYGDTGEHLVDEETDRGTGFLSEIATQWEEATQQVEKSGVRTVHLRTGIVLSPKGGVLKKMLIPFKMGLGGVVGNGKQYMSWISIDDVVAIIETFLRNQDCSGAYNLVAPQTVTNDTFTKTLGKALHRPTFIPMPAFIARLAFGEMADALLLSSCRVDAMRLSKLGYSFIDTQLESALNRLLK